MAKQLFSVSGQHLAAVNGAAFVPAVNAVISTSDDKFAAFFVLNFGDNDCRTVLVWLQRSNGQYWPSVHQSLPSEGSSLVFDPSSRRLFVGTGLGAIFVWWKN